MADLELVAILRQGVQAWNAWKEQHPGAIADLKETDLSGINLRTANLRLADLRSSDLSNSDLSFTDLTGAMLHGTNLNQANLGSANLNSVTLNGATLRGTDLRRTILNNVFMPKTDLTHAYCHYTVFASIDLSEVIGLKAVKHTGPSNIDIRTLYRSRGRIPPMFLRGCGVPEDFIKRTEGIYQTEYFWCFISYSTADEEFAKLLYETLQGKGIRCWFAPERILPGERLETAINLGILESDKVLFCASKSSLTEKWWVDFEVDKALKKERDLQRRRREQIGVLIPLNLDGYLFSDEYDTHPKQSLFEGTAVADFVGWKEDQEKFEREVQKLILALRTANQKPPPEPKL